MIHVIQKEKAQRGISCLPGL